ncbi:hypothetical protein VQ643_15885 [Pseudomonas sp. F1_0610]|uniref:hypothetical protein n=1 Tax=Pseudomonas sp. F1_0610 TaxID=3114284 RepID=UPI0039C18168
MFVFSLKKPSLTAIEGGFSGIGMQNATTERWKKFCSDIELPDPYIQCDLNKIYNVRW